MTENDSRIWAYGPNGEAEIFPRPEAIPAGWALSPGPRQEDRPAPIGWHEEPPESEGSDDIPHPTPPSDGDQAEAGPDAPRRRGRPPKAL